MSDERTHSQLCLYRTRPDGSEWWCVCFADREERDYDEWPENDA